MNAGSYAITFGVSIESAIITSVLVGKPVSAPIEIKPLLCLECIDFFNLANVLISTSNSG